VTLFVLIAALSACSFLQGPPIDEVVVNQIAGELCSLGHPNATFVSSQMTGWQQGSISTKTHDRYVDIDVKYRRKKEDHDDIMSVRLYLENVNPCRVSMDVLNDTGKTPVMLDNALASGVIGQAICDSMTP
jgi:hypothetical protein